MSLIYVKTKPGRRAFADRKDREEIPSDRFIGVENTPLIQRLIHFYGDIEVGQKPTATPTKPAKKAPPPPPPPPAAASSVSDRPKE